MRDEVTIADPWCRHIPDLHRALADPSCASRLPRVTDRLDLFHTCGLWEAQHYLLRAILGWQAVGDGPAWWYRSGKPAENSRNGARVVAEAVPC
jgi:hypothetical protein